MKKSEIKNLIKSLIKEQQMNQAPRTGGSRSFSTEIKLEGISEKEAQELEALIRQHNSIGGQGGSSRRIRLILRKIFGHFVFGISISF